MDTIIDLIILIYYLCESVHLPTTRTTGSTWTTGLSTPVGLVANNLSRVAFLVFFDEDNEESVADSGGVGGELGGIAMCLSKNNNIN